MSEEKRNLVGRGGQLAGGGGGDKRRSYGGTDLTSSGRGGQGKDPNGIAGPSYEYEPPYQVEANHQISSRPFEYSDDITLLKNGIKLGHEGIMDSSGSLSNPSRIHYDGATECAFAEPPEGLDKTARNRLLIASLLCMVFMVGEIVGGVLSNSLAIISDGIHLLTDFASFMIAMSALHLAQRKASDKLNFGWHRIEILGACLSILLLWVLTGVLCYEAVLRILSMDFIIEPKILLIAASTGVFFNICLATILNEDLDAMLGRGDKEDGEADQEKGQAARHSALENSKSPSDGLTVGVSNGENRLANIEPAKPRQKPGNINVKAAYVHVLGDLVQSLGILASALIIYFKPEWKIADPCCTFFFSFMVILTTSTIMKDVLVVLMEAAPKEADVPGMKTDLMNIPGVVGLHNYRVWSLTLDKMAVSAHLNVAPGADPYQVLDDATYVVRELHYAHESYIQLERGESQYSKAG